MDNVVGSTNNGLTSRWDLTKNRQIVSMEGPIHSDICQQDRLILNQVPICIKFFQSTNQFRLMNGTAVEYQVEITDAILKVGQVTVNPKIIIAHNEALSIKIQL